MAESSVRSNGRRIRIAGRSADDAAASIQALDGGKWQSMADFHSKLTRKQEDAIIALLSNRSVEDAARACNTPSRTLYRWLKERDFDAAYRQAKRDAYKQSIARMHHLSNAAVSTLGKVMLDPVTPASTRVRAADSILNHTAKAIEIEDMEARVSELERAANEANPSWRKPR
jgi:hypothetical protein